MYTKIDLKTLPEKINSKRLSFANENDLQEYLGLTPGSVTPLGIINDKGQKVTVVLDKELKNNKVLIHPNRNTATVSTNASSALWKTWMIMFPCLPV